MELLIGCGGNHRKQLSFGDLPRDWTNLVTLDADEACSPSVVHDLTNLPLPFDDGMFDEIHAYEVLEHTGQQGDWRFFFNQFYEFWRILKPNGHLIATVPMWDSPWAWGDPGHTRVIPKEALIFLDQRNYAQCGETAMTDYRAWWKGDFEVVLAQENVSNHKFAFALRAVK